MGLVRSAEEIAAMEEAMARPRFLNAEMLQVEFLTTPETVRRVLPPGFEPVEEPSIIAAIGRWQSNCVGDFEGGAIYVACRVGELEGAYTLAMYMSADSSVIFGRDLFGEPKKVARMSMYRHGEEMNGWIERHGVRLFEISGELGPDEGAVSGNRNRFNIKATPNPDGRGLERDAVVTVADFAFSFNVSRSGPGTVRLGGTPHDPLDEIEVVEPRLASYVEGDLAPQARALTTIPAGEFFPYALGRLDYWPTLDTAGRGDD